MNGKPENEERNPAADKLLQTILPRVLIVLLALVFIMLAIGVMFWGIIEPWRFADSFTRFVFVVLIAFSLALFLFIAYPSELGLENIPVIHLPVSIAGPAVMFIVVWLLFVKLLPLPQTYRFHPLLDADGAPLTGKSWRDLNVTVLGTSNSFLLVPASNLSDPAGIIFFYNQDQRTIRAKVSYNSATPVTVTFDRGKNDPVELKSNETPSDN